MYFLDRKHRRGYREKASGLGCIERFSVINLSEMVIMNEARRVLSVSIPEKKSWMAVEGLRNGKLK